MSAIDEMVEAINGIKAKYDEAATQLASVIEKAETTSGTLAAVGADGLAEVVDGVKDGLQTISTNTSGLTSRLEDAAKTLEAAKG